jgi:hypothetical protein
MGMVVWHAEKARATWGMDYMEKSIFIYSTIPVIDELELDAVKVFDYFNLDMPKGPDLAKGPSYPIVLDIRTHLITHLMCGANDLGCRLGREQLMSHFFPLGRGGTTDRPG